MNDNPDGDRSLLSSTQNIMDGPGRLKKKISIVYENDNELKTETIYKRDLFKRYSGNILKHSRGGCSSGGCGTPGGCAANAISGNITEITDTFGNTVTYEYDTVGRVTHTTDPSGNTTETMYEAILDNGDPKGKTITQTKTRIDETSASAQIITTVSHYDSYGNLISTEIENSDESKVFSGNL